MRPRAISPVRASISSGRSIDWTRPGLFSHWIGTTEEPRHQTYPCLWWPFPCGWHATVCVPRKGEDPSWRHRSHGREGRPCAPSGVLLRVFSSGFSLPWVSSARHGWWSRRPFPCFFFFLLVYRSLTFFGWDGRCIRSHPLVPSPPIHPPSRTWWWTSLSRHTCDRNRTT